MALTEDGERVLVRDDAIRARFGIAQDGTPSPEALALQRAIRDEIAAIAVAFNAEIVDSRAKSVALTHLEDFLLWAGKAIFEEA